MAQEAHFFEQGEGEHRLILAVGVSSWGHAPGGSRSYNPPDRQYRRSEEHLSRFMPERRFTSGLTALNDYNFRPPPADMKADRPGDAAHAHADLEVY
ncbi:contractile injection system protein, VgrG/Pvc8 family [Aurantimonas sp. VKM B-3413]|uniref:contractile injection system protein, VgrG/Pvc8 family n=1 Tax=Aurantimonas sp. VKM B-3413 TaxID=2779401 RepID=UPI001E551ECB|nr:contractile injection system protein, VgrG/Pvc8 family [Aurantimonas sp. VKM B-3413]MCB8839616.1 phage late control D family protein [Aurantimonas sp. VKM B-3413]